jgi:DnaK suppressor protein
MNPTSTNVAAADAVGPGAVRWRLALETRWQRKVDEVATLSRALRGLSEYPEETLAEPGVRRARRLGARIDGTLEGLAAIEDALARLDQGSYGICAGCDRPLAAEWLADEPETRYCPDCSLHLVSWQSPAVPTAGACRGRHQVRRPASANPTLTGID